MVNEEQKSKINKRILLTTRAFLDTGKSNAELAEILGISKSTIQRDLTSLKIIELLGQDVYDEIQAMIEQNKMDAVLKGGIVSQRKNEYIKDEMGKFNGSKGK